MAYEFVRPRYTSIEPKDIYETGQASDDALGRALLYITYLTGARIGEAVRLRATHIQLQDNFYKITMIVQKKRKMRGERRNVPIPRGELARCYEDEMMSPVLKYLSDNKHLTYPLWKWGKPSEEYPKGKAFCMGIYLSRHFQLKTEAHVKDKKWGWIDKVITKPMHPHFLRHCRSDHLVEYYNFTDTKLRLFYHWADTKMAAEYTQIKDLSDAFYQKK